MYFLNEHINISASGFDVATQSKSNIINNVIMYFIDHGHDEKHKLNSYFQRKNGWYTCLYKDKRVD